MWDIVLNVQGLNMIKNICYKNNRYLSQKLNQQINSQNVRDEKLEIEDLESKVKFFSLKEDKVQQGMSLIQQTSQKIDNLKNMGQRLKELSTEYNKANSDDAKTVKDEAKKILSDIDTLLTDTFGNNSSIRNNQVYIPDEENGKGTTICMKNLNIQLEDETINVKANNSTSSSKIGKKDTNKITIEGDLSIDDILKDTDRIENKLISPINEYSNYLSQQTDNLTSITLFDSIKSWIFSTKLDILKQSYQSGARCLNLNKLIKQDPTRAVSAQSLSINKNIVMKLL
ncbi:hypothetical protein [Clostridium sp.]|uniref:hypothetical protein n=2 Tax=Clostridium sp. TaxID=1506 RepID=UPI0025BAB5C6|nr:hypothetical protein [Clostridium sp.]MCI1813643.1 hypothetical protein [Clostridium sp.]